MVTTALTSSINGAAADGRGDSEIEDSGLQPNAGGYIPDWCSLPARHRQM
jgi:hypothetical protein